MAHYFAASLLLVPTLALAQETASPPPVQEKEATRTPLMRLLDRGGISKPLDDLGISIYGYAEGSYTFSLSNPPADEIGTRGFDFEHNNPILNAVDLTIERPIDYTSGKFDIGGRVEWQWGSDARFQHSTGLLDNENPDRRQEFDLTAAYLDFGIPVGTGLQIRVGKFVTLPGYEVVDPTGNALYSHGFLFNYAVPYAHTGVLATYDLNDKNVLDFGVTRGWDDALRDKNDKESFIGRVTTTYTEELTSYVSLLVGPEQTANPGSAAETTDPNGNYRYLLDVVVTYAATDKLNLALNADLGFEEDVVADGSNAWFYGVAGYATYQLNDVFTLAGRAEWFRDEEGSRVGFGQANYYSATAGVNIKPFYADEIGSHLVFRPEIRLDAADTGVFDGGTDRYQVTIAMDVVFSF